MRAVARWPGRLARRPRASALRSRRAAVRPGARRCALRMADDGEKLKADVNEAAKIVEKDVKEASQAVQTRAEPAATTAEEYAQSASDSFAKYQAMLSEYMEDVTAKLENVDPDAVVDDIGKASTTLFDNFMAGEWLKRGEVYGAAQLVLAFMMLTGQPLVDALASLLLGPGLFISGAVLSGKALVDLGIPNLSLWPRPVSKGTLVTTGLYEKVRHPVYSGVLLVSLGNAAATHSAGSFALTAALAALFVKKIEVEEEFLKEKYPEYSSYQISTPYKLIPKVW
ncbi:Cobalt-zinc-cadmium resistance protein CzcN [Porphyridium purpureum]|uniref:Cobalt-zinc-cadmium resistance protein CzcN n=1 Tax=Porphyridium purpureum TaxID=35688 RepID=A0A5J4YSJ9_PORPP|nr:Cobalt-zinc-cadmium resistance protein CzcN [Porphyridium purpureum]|eukprot:POR0417..scf229_5